MQRHVLSKLAVPGIVEQEKRYFSENFEINDVSLQIVNVKGIINLKE